MRKNTMVAVGDVLTVDWGDHIESHKITSLSRGQYGVMILVKDQTTSGFGAAYLPFELAPGPLIWGWKGWCARYTVTLDCGQSVGAVCFSRRGRRGRSWIEDYEAEWERSMEAGGSDGMDSMPTDIRIS